MTDQTIPTVPAEAQEEEKSQARLDYESGIEFIKNKDHAQAANAFHNALIGFEQDNESNGVANASDKLGDICAEKGDVDTAMRHYDKAYSICQEAKDVFSLFSIEKKRAKLMLDSKKFARAIEMYLEILDHYGSFRNPQGSVDTLETLAAIYTETGDEEKTAEAYKMIAAIHKSFKHSRHAEEYLKKADEVSAS